MKNLISVFCVVGILLLSCGSSMTLVNKKPIEVEWIVGIWKLKDKDNFEKWIKVSPTEFKGVAYNMDAGYATITENMRIFMKSKK